VGNEENGYQVPDSKKTMINGTKEPRDIHMKTLKDEILEDITKKFMEKILINQNVNMHTRYSKTPKIKNMRRHRNK
jgi:hypothetical protein